MTTRSTNPLDRTLHKANQWLVAVMRALGTKDRRLAYAALRAVLHALRDRLPVTSMAHLGAQLPVLVRGVFYDGWHPREGGKPERVRTVDAFLDRVALGVPRGTKLDPEAATRAVFAVLARHIDPGELDSIVHVLPKPVRALWQPEVEPDDG